MTDMNVRTREWADLDRSEIEAARVAGAMVAIPVGAIEQHGDHLPVDTDARLCALVTRRAAARVAAPIVLVAPALAFGFSPHHLSFAGTISLRLATYLAVLRDIANSLCDAGFSRVVFVNGHGGNSAPLRSIVTELVTDGRPVAAIDYWAPSEATWSRLLRGGLARAGHACELETALVLAGMAEGSALGERVTLAAAGLPPRLSQPWMAGSGDDPVTAHGAAWPPIFQADDCGYFGDPAAADRQRGQDILEVIVAGLAQFLRDFARAPLRCGVARDPARPAILPPLV